MAKKKWRHGEGLFFLFTLISLANRWNDETIGSWHGLKNFASFLFSFSFVVVVVVVVAVVVSGERERKRENKWDYHYVVVVVVVAAVPSVSSDYLEAARKKNNSVKTR